MPRMLDTLSGDLPCGFGTCECFETFTMPIMSKKSAIVLVGYRGSGKSTVAKLVAKVLSFPLIDLDSAIEQRAGCVISELFADQGEDAFRDLEAQCLGDMLSEPGPFILATGGGAVIRPENRTLLRQSGATVIYLEASVDVLAQRLSRGRKGVRPSLTGKPITEEVAEVLALRDPWYREVASHTISAEQPLDAVVQEIKYLV